MTTSQLPLIGTLPPVDVRVEFRHLSEQVRAARLLDRRPRFAGVRIFLTIGAFVIGWAALFRVGDSWMVLGVAVFLAVMSVQVLFIGHDAGHEQLFTSRRANRLVGLLVGDLLTGLSFTWWVPKHNAHHASPNQIGLDPDIGPGAVSASNALGDRRGPVRALLHVFSLVPLVLLEVGMHLSSAKALAKRRGRGAQAEWALIGAYTGFYLIVVFWRLSPLHAVAFIAVQQGLFGLYLRLSFAPNHKGMPIVEHDTTMGYVQRQVITARNVVGGRFITFMLGGLNYQIEHHLFPAMPRANLAQAQDLVRGFCARSGLDYREETLLNSYRQAVSSLRATPSVPLLSGRDECATR